MDADIIRVTLFEDTYAYIGRASDEENVLRFKKFLQEYISILNEVIVSDFDKLSDKDLYKLLSKIYSISLSEKDYLKMLSMYNNKKYTSIYRIPTKMTFKSLATEGHGRSFDWWDQLYQVYYVVAASDTFKFDYNKTYSKSEIKKLSSDKTIVLLNKVDKTVDYIDFTQQRYEEIPTLGINNFSDNSEFILDNFNLFGKLLRIKFKKRKVLKDVKIIVDALNEDIDDVLSPAKSKYSIYYESAKDCKKWYDLSKEKKDYQDIQKRLELKK